LLRSLSFAAGNTVRLELQEATSEFLEIEASTDLQSWESVIVLTDDGREAWVQDDGAIPAPQRFYRAKP
jgi:hypothetical protein